MKKFMSLMLLVCACLLSQPVKAQQVTPDNAGYIVKVGDMALVMWNILLLFSLNSPLQS